MYITGEWNGVMMASWPNGRTEVFVDTQSMSIIKKRVKPISQQQEYESRRLWKDLTYHLRMGNVSNATDTKCAIEQHQRDLDKQRQEKGEKWQQRVREMIMMLFPCLVFSSGLDIQVTTLSIHSIILMALNLSFVFSLLFS